MSRRWLFAVPTVAMLLVVALVHVSCEGVLRTACSGCELTLFANPKFIPANGGVSIVTCVVMEPAGTPVSNGTVVLFFTNLGRIPERAETTNGIVRVNFVSDSRSGEATVTAVSGGTPAPVPTASGGSSSSAATSGANSASDTITIGNLNAKSVHVSADPPTTSLNGTSYITANVLDDAGNPVQGAPVFFQLEAATSTAPPPPSPAPPPTPTPAIRDFLDSGGAARFTDNDGRAFDVLRARRSVPGTVQVHAKVPSGGGTLLDAFVEVRIN